MMWRDLRAPGQEGWEADPDIPEMVERSEPPADCVDPFPDDDNLGIEPTPTHGATRNFRQVTECGAPVEFLNATTRESVYSGPGCSHTFPQGERWCGVCREWKPQRGIIAMLVGCPDCKTDWRPR